jgi:hypothetical protein
MNLTLGAAVGCDGSSVCMIRIILFQKTGDDVMTMPNNISIHIEGGYLWISGQIPVASAGAEIDSFIQELKFQLFGENQPKNDHPKPLAPKDLNEKDAAKYIGRSVSFLRDCRYKGKKSGQERGPKYTRDSERCIRYPVKNWTSGLKAVASMAPAAKKKPSRRRAG